MADNLLPYDGELYFNSALLTVEESDALYLTLSDSIAWEQRSITLFGKRMLQPRLIAWHGDVGANYRYSGADYIAQPWTAELSHLRERVEGFFKRRFNSVLLNYYRDGNDSMGWHRDNEKQLGGQPAIASVNLGATRLFKLQHVTTKELRKIDLSSGSALLMAGCCQQYWRHSVPKQKGIITGRINLTFRYIEQG
jgi:alkylated DNA repair dioxygenase AlkB|tara:strand:- start:3213 stop:3797 length:585 start_codon:yes stop_codon:yes gene_type:complete